MFGIGTFVEYARAIRTSDDRIIQRVRASLDIAPLSYARILQYGYKQCSGSYPLALNFTVNYRVQFVANFFVLKKLSYSSSRVRSSIHFCPPAHPLPLFIVVRTRFMRRERSFYRFQSRFLRESTTLFSLIIILARCSRFEKPRT